jgi:hypothetical protein
MEARLPIFVLEGGQALQVHAAPFLPLLSDFHGYNIALRDLKLRGGLLRNADCQTVTPAADLRNHRIYIPYIQAVT